MKFFNIDLHCSVIEDIKTQFKRLGHETESHLMSGHAWVFGYQRASKGFDDPQHEGQVGYGPVNMVTYGNLFWQKNDSDATTKIAQTLKDSCPELDAFDGFIATYPASFAFLYEKFCGHVVTHIPVRYDLGFNTSFDKLQLFNNYLAQGEDAGKITVAANSLYDAKYYEYFSGRRARHIPSLCDYTSRLSPFYSTPEHDHFYGFGEHPGCREMQKHVPEVKFIRDALTDYYKLDMIPKARGVVWIPYTSSIMSFFEHYWLSIPLFVPTKRFLLELWNAHFAMSQNNWFGEFEDGLRGSVCPKLGTDLPDPNTMDGRAAWMDTYDFYNTSEFKHITYFDSWDELRSTLNSLSTADLQSISKKMRVQNAVRRSRVLGEWLKVLERVVSWNTDGRFRLLA